VLRALCSGASGLNAQQLKIDATANNLANINTTGFKKMRMNFSQLVNQLLENSGIPTEPGNREITAGSGVRAADAVVVFDPGNLVETGRELDLAVQGDGFFKVVRGNEEYYTRDGTFSLDGSGNLVSPGGCGLEGVQLESGTSKVTITADGVVKAEGPNGVTEAGQINLYKFTSMAGLKLEGENLFSFDNAAGEVISGTPASPGYGIVKQGFLETANLDLTEEMTSLIEAQRLYSFNARTVRTVDEMWGMANNLRK